MLDINQRFSPTGVGNVGTDWLHAYHAAVQPHWCGERATLGLELDLSYGSAPLVWGTCDDDDHDHEFMRFSPTGVGNVAG